VKDTETRCETLSVQARCGHDRQRRTAGQRGQRGGTLGPLTARESFTPVDHWAYREAVARLAIELGWTLQEADLAIRHLDRLPREPRLARHETTSLPLD
jgi:hypothetical protein